MKYIGAHVSIAGGVETAVDRAIDIGANAFGIFTRNQRQWKAPPLTDESAAAFRSKLADAEIAPHHVVPHSSYLINIASPEQGTRDRSLGALVEETRRAAALGLAMLNFHPGSHLGRMSDADGLSRIADGVNEVLARTTGVSLVLETTAGSGNNLGGAFDHLAGIIDRVEDRSRVGVCIDTCHLYAAGYDIRAPVGWRRVMRLYDSTIGFGYLRAMHLNDCKSHLGGRKDRHAGLGAGRLGLEAFRAVVRDPRLHGIPLILETPKPSRWPAEIRLLRAFAEPPPRRNASARGESYRHWANTRRIVRSHSGFGGGR